MPSIYRIENNKQPNNIKQENKGGKKTPPPKKLSFKTCKKNTINSLNDVEYFLRNFNKFIKYVKLYKILK